MIKIDKMMNENTIIAPIKYGYIWSTTFLTIGCMMSSVTIWTFSLLWSSCFIVWRSFLTTTWNDIKFKRNLSFISIEQTYGKYLLHNIPSYTIVNESKQTPNIRTKRCEKIHCEYWFSDWSVCDMLGPYETWRTYLSREVRTYVSRILPDKMVWEKIHVSAL